MRAALLVFLIGGSTALAASPGVPPAPWDVPFTDNVKGIIAAAAKAPAREKQEFHVLLSEITIDYDEAGLETFRRRIVLSFDTEDAARQNASVEAQWEPWHEERPQIRVRAIQQDGTVNELDPATLTEAAPQPDSPDVYSNRKVLRGPIPNVRAGTIIEREITLREKPSLFQGRFVRGLPTIASYWYETLRITVRAAPKLPLRVGWRGEGKAPAIKRERGLKVARFERSAVAPQTEWTGYLPVDLPSTPELYVSIGASWPEHAKAYAQVVDAQLSASKPFAAEAKAQLKGDRSPAHIAQQLSDWIHTKVRYTGLHFNDAAVVPRPPSETVERGFGDCKDLATLMVGLLRASGIKASVALLTSQGTEFPTDAPGLTWFDHAIVYVQTKKPFFIDVTADELLIGETSPWLAGRSTLVADPALKNPIVRIPEATSSDHSFRLKRELRPAEIDFGGFESTIEERGHYAAGRRWQWQHEDRKRAEEGVKDFAKRLYACDTLTHVEVVPGALRKPTTMSMGATDCHAIFTADRQSEQTVWLSSLLTDVPGELTGWNDDDDGDADDKTEKKARTLPLRWPVPFQSEGEYRIVPPAGFRTAVTAEKKSWKLGPASFERELSREDDGTVVVHARFDSGRRTYSPADVAAFQKAFAELDDVLVVTVRFERIADAELEAGHVTEALAEFRKWTTAHPKEALHHIRYANALLELGFGAAAQQEAKRGIDAEPDSSAAHRVYGYMLQHNLLGMRFGNGWQRTKAIAELRQALKLNPESALVRRALADVLEFNEAGQRFGQGISLDEPIALFAEARKLQKDDNEDLNYLIALWRAGKVKEVRALSDELPQRQERDQIRLAATVVGESPKAAAQELARLAEKGNRDDLVVGTLSELLMKREYDLARKFVALVGTPGTQVAQLQRHLLDDVRRVDTKKIPASDPRWPMLRFFELILEPGSVDPKTLFAKSVTVDPQKLGDSLGVPLRVITSAGVPIPTFKDLLYTLPDFAVDGTRQTGARASWKSFGAQEGAVYLVDEGGQWRIRTFGGDRASVAVEALTRLEKKDLPGARKWAAWVERERAESTEADRAWRAAWSNLGEQPPEKLMLALAWAAVESDDPKARAHALELLQKAKPGTEPERVAVDWALISGFSERSPEVALAAIDRLQQRRPSLILSMLRLRTLTEARRKAEALTAAEALLRETGSDPDMLEIVATAASKVGEPEKARAYRAAAVATGRAGSGTYNNLAWAELYDEPVALADAEAHAQRANELGNYSNPFALHTLASVHAETGRGRTAHALLMKSIALSNRTEAREYDWYVVGRIAETYGLKDVAKDAYARAMKDPKKQPEAAKLAQRRMKGLDGAEGDTAIVRPGP